MLKVYVAGGSTEVQRAATIIAALRASGVHVTYDWTPDVLRRGDPADGYRTERTEPEAVLAIRGALDADLVWFLVPHRGSSGGGFEVGAAWHAGRLVVCSGPSLTRFFFGVMLVEYDTDEQALEVVLRHARAA